MLCRAQRGKNLPTEIPVRRASMKIQESIHGECFPEPSKENGES